MLGHIGFSYVGLLFLLALIVPNLLWTRHPPKGYSLSLIHILSPAQLKMYIVTSP